MAEYKYVDWPGLQYYHSKVTDLIDSRLRDCIRFGGEVLFETLESPDTPDLNIIYRILNSFTVSPVNPSKEWFDNSMWNKTYPAGTLLQVVQTEKGVVYTVFMQPAENGESSDVDLSNYYTIEETDAKIIDALKPYATIEFVTSKLDAIQSLLNTHTDELGRLTSRVNSVEQFIASDIEPAIKQLEDAVTNIEETKADVSDIPDLSGYAKLTDIPDTSSFATEDFVKQKIAEAQLSGGEVDLSIFYTKGEIDAKGFATEEYVQQLFDEADVVGMDTRLTQVENQQVINSTKLNEIENQSATNAAAITALDGEIDQVNATLLTMDTQITNISQNLADLVAYGTF